jgi:hypothetical protein
MYGTRICVVRDVQVVHTFFVPVDLRTGKIHHDECTGTYIQMVH